MGERVLVMSGSVEVDAGVVGELESRGIGDEGVAAFALMPLFSAHFEPVVGSLRVDAADVVQGVVGFAVYEGAHAGEEFLVGELA